MTLLILKGSVARASFGSGGAIPEPEEVREGAVWTGQVDQPHELSALLDQLDELEELEMLEPGLVASAANNDPGLVRDLHRHLSQQQERQEGEALELRRQIARHMESVKEKTTEQELSDSKMDEWARALEESSGVASLLIMGMGSGQVAKLEKEKAAAGEVERRHQQALAATQAQVEELAQRASRTEARLVVVWEARRIATRKRLEAEAAVRDPSAPPDVEHP